MSLQSEALLAQERLIAEVMARLARRDTLTVNELYVLQRTLDAAHEAIERLGRRAQPKDDLSERRRRRIQHMIDTIVSVERAFCDNQARADLLDRLRRHLAEMEAP